MCHSVRTFSSYAFYAAVSPCCNQIRQLPVFLCLLKIKTYSLEQFKGRVCIAVFLSKDDTPGCTKEACTIRDQFGEFETLGIVVLGVSADTAERHKEFAEKYSLPFLLLADTTKETIKAYQADGMLFTKRISYLIDPQGMIVNAYPDVDPASHAEEILKDVRSRVG
jgi:peroxiredoxin Q/BCP